MPSRRIYTDEERKERRRESSKKYQDENRERLNEQSKKWKRENKEKVRESSKKYKDKNREKIRESKKKYHDENREKIRERHKKWRELNKDKIREKNKKYNSTELGIKSYRISNWKGYGIICEDWDSLYEIYIHTHNCEYCNKSFKSSQDRQLDHDHDITDKPNVRAILCIYCNTIDVLK